MKASFAAILFVLSAGMAMAADPVEGNWFTQPDDNGNFGRVQIAACGPALCGTLVEAFGPDGRPVQSDRIGKQIVWDMKPASGGRYEGGKIFAPDRGKTYASKMALSGDRLTVSGCVMMICRGQEWRRAR